MVDTPNTTMTAYEKAKLRLAVFQEMRSSGATMEQIDEFGPKIY